MPCHTTPHHTLISADIKHVDDGVMDFAIRAGAILAEAVEFLHKEETLKAVLQESTAYHTQHIYQQAAMVRQYTLHNPSFPPSLWLHCMLY